LRHGVRLAETGRQRVARPLGVLPYGVEMLRRLFTDSRSELARGGGSVSGTEIGVATCRKRAFGSLRALSIWRERMREP